MAGRRTDRESVVEVNTSDLEDPGPTILDKIKEKSGTTVSLDYFLYTCLEEDRTSRSLRGEAAEACHRSRWPGVQEYFLGRDFPEDDHVPHPDLSGSLEEQLTALFAWYRGENPVLSHSVPMDYETHAEVSPAFVRMVQDVGALLSIDKDRPAPTPDPVSAPKADEAKADEAKADEAKTAAPDTLNVEAEAGSASETQQKAEAATAETATAPTEEKHEPKDPWDIAKAVLVEVFPKYAEFFTAYGDWLRRDRASAGLDLASIPPVGRYIGVHKRALARKARAQASPRPQHRRPEGNAREGGSGRPQQNTDASPEMKREAMSEVAACLRTLQSQPALASLELKPQNSFLRRLQHQEVSEKNGFKSVSIGVGSARAVKIVRAGAEEA